MAAIFALIIAGISYAYYQRYVKQPVSTLSPPTDNKQSEPTVPDATVRVIATGDMIAHDALNARAKTNGGYDYFQFMDRMKPYFDAADVRFCNQATLAAGEAYSITGYPVFNAPLEFARDMAKVGCNVINTGSNHSNDKSQAALEASVAAWYNLPNILAVAGANRSEDERQTIRHFEVKGVKFAFLSYTTYLNSPNKQPYSVTMYSPELAKQQIAEARQTADIVMVSMRWGTEYSAGINAAQTKQSQFLADQGADIVVGHGPHVLAPVKKLKGKNGRSSYIWYSLGNFLNAQVEIESLISGFAVMDIDTQSKTITSVGYLPLYMHYEWTAQQKAAQALLARQNFEMYLLEEAGEPLLRSQNNTTVNAQMQRVAKLLNTYTDVPILTKAEYLGN
jgi:poly-gamma-glutamate capsule biosynthesis protein CapA/YwtB (metallophosphatase superfamily)